MTTTKIIQGNALDVLRRGPDESVHCVVTSPSYFGLRDYGTARWEGGDLTCGHKRRNERPRIEGKQSAATAGSRNAMGGPSNDAQAAGRACFKDVCGKCGAHRVDAQIGLEKTPEEYIARLVEVFREVRRVLRDDGVMFIVIGDSYVGGKGASGMGSQEYQDERVKRGTSINRIQQTGGPGQTRPLDDRAILRSCGLKPKDLVGIPWMLAFALRADGWYLRQAIVWAKLNPMPESVRDRCTRSHEMIFMFAKSQRYFYDADAIKEPVKESSLKRLNQPSFDTQTGGSADYGTSGVNANRSMRKALTNFKVAVFGGANKHAGYGTRRHSGRKDSGNYVAVGANKRDVWMIPASPSNWDFCAACETLYAGSERSTIPRRIAADGKVVRTCPKCKREDRWVAHFAAYPAALIEPCIKAGTSEYGVCPKCGAPWKRMTKRRRLSRPELPKDDPRYRPSRYSGAYENINGKGDAGYTEVTTVGWGPACKCDAGEPVPATTLDPFAGSGTTLLVVQRLGRNSIGIDLSEDYCALMRARCNKEKGA